mgnify:CR=1 FL=1
MASLLPIFFIGLIAFFIWYFLRSKEGPSSIPETGGPDPKHRTEVIQWAKDLLADPDHHAIIDTETTGLSSSDEVIQVAAIDTSGKVLLNSFIKPIGRKTIPRAATEKHGITMKMLKDAPAYPEIAPALSDIVAKRNIVCYNAAFDGRLINQTAQKTGVPIIEDKWACAMLAYARYRQVWNFSRNGYLWHKLPRGEHSALGDCLAALDLIKEMAGMKKSP